MGMKAILFALALNAAATTPVQQPTAEAVVAAEHAFAAEVAANGIKRGFLAYAAPDAIFFAPGPVNARQDLEAQPDGPPENPPLAWWPDFAGIARSGDLGFTTGPATTPVRYFTVWKKQADGGWKWIYDGGLPLAAPIAGGARSQAVLLDPADTAAGSAERALAEVATLEARIAASTAKDARGAVAGLLAKQAIVGSSPLVTFAGTDPEEALAARPPAMTLHSLGHTASSAGDMVFSYGEARWTADSQPRWGHYVRIWQKQPAGWRLVADMLINARNAPPNPG